MTDKNKAFPDDDLLAGFEQSLPWESIEASANIHFVFENPGQWRCPLSVLLRIYLVQRVGGLSDPVMVNVLRGSLSVREFVRLSWFALPSVEQLGSFRRFMEKHGFDKRLLEMVEMTMTLPERAAGD